jgi:gamma-glutamyltranspeptidase / glutathione hydrolase
MKSFADAGLAVGRVPAVAGDAMVATPSQWASLVGLDLLRKGGNSVDAAIAVSAALIVAQPHQTGLGGDAFWLIRPGSTTATIGLNASGRAPAAASADELLDAGHQRIPPRSGWAVTVPGIVAGWSEAHARYGRLSFDRLLAPAIDGAERGVPISPLLARQFRLSASMLAYRRESARLFGFAGKPPSPGVRLVQPDLAATLRTLAADPALFYEGSLAERICFAACEEGGWLATEDLAAHHSDWTEPVRASFADWGVEEMPPNSQGLAALVGLRLFERGGMAEDETAGDRAHRGVQAAKILMAVRDAEIGDPEGMRRPPAELLSDAYLGPLLALASQDAPLTRKSIERLIGAAPAPAVTHPGGDTVHFAVTDAGGMSVSCIQSVFEDFGSGIVVPGTGIVLHNRGSSFLLRPEQVNSLAPGRRPLHTLAPAMATVAGETAAVFGCMGGHAQAQVHLQLIAAMAGRGADPATALAQPRWFVSPEQEDVVLVEDRGPLARELSQRGHAVRLVEPYAQEMGHAQAILTDQTTGALFGATDPRSEGLALGY